MGSRFSQTKPDQHLSDEDTGRRNGRQELGPKQQNTPLNLSADKTEDNINTSSHVYQIHHQHGTQTPTDASIHIGPYTLTFALAQRISRDLRNAVSSPAIAELDAAKPASDAESALYDLKVQLLDDHLILLTQSWVELPPALSGVLENKHLATLFECAHGCCSHMAHDKSLAFISCMGINIVDRNKQRRCMCVEIDYTCRCSTLHMCKQCPSQLIFSRHELRDGRIMLVTTNWRNLGRCLDIEDAVWQSQTTGLNLLSTESRRGQSIYEAPEWIPLQGYTGLIPYGPDATDKIRDILDRDV